MYEEDSRLRLTRTKRQLLPYLLLLQPGQQRGAAYDIGHRLLTADASPKLIAWALQHRVHAASWDDGRDVHNPLPRPTWVPQGSLAGWQLLWLRDESTPDDLLRTTPPR